MNVAALVAEEKFSAAKLLTVARLNQIVEKKLAVLRKVIAESMDEWCSFAAEYEKENYSAWFASLR
jgi:hypothetical protein